MTLFEGWLVGIPGGDASGEQEPGSRNTFQPPPKKNGTFFFPLFKCTSIAT